MNSFIFDIEIKKGYFSVLFIKTETNLKLVDAYCKAHYTGNINLMNKIKNTINYKLFTITRNKTNDYVLLIDFLKFHREYIGFNSNNYDNYLLDYIIMTISKYDKFGYNRSGSIVDHLFQLSDQLISQTYDYSSLREVFKYYKRPYFGMDLQKVLYLDKPKFISLKQCAVQLKWYWIQDLYYDPYEEYTIDQQEEIELYLWNDVLITHALYWNQIKEINLRNDISKIYNKNLRNYSRSDIANKLVSDFYAAKTGLEYKEFKDLRTYRKEIVWDRIISNAINFKTPEFNNFFNNLKKSKYLIYDIAKENNETNKLAYSVFYKNKIYTIAKGGLHSVDKPGKFVSDSKYIYIDVDVSSFYPRIIINKNVSPKHLNSNIFLEIVEEITDDRLNSKKVASVIKKLDNLTPELELQLSEATTKAEALKIVINAIYGKFGDQYSFLYDPKAMYTVTINGQLYLLMLIEIIELAGFEVISANTDGIICKVERSREVEFNTITNDWCKSTKFELEHTRFEKYIRYSVNDYIAVKEGYYQTTGRKEDYLKTKGLFTSDTQIDKGYDKPVIAKALRAFFVDDIPISTFIKTWNDIYDFCISVKTSKDFQNEYHYIENNELKIKVLQKDIRFYISNSGGALVKAYREPKPNKRGTVITHISFNANTYNEPFLMYKPMENFKDYNINYNHYISEASKIVYDILYGKQKGKKVTQVGTMFDNID